MKRETIDVYYCNVQLHILCLCHTGVPRAEFLCVLVFFLSSSSFPLPRSSTHPFSPWPVLVVTSLCSPPATIITTRGEAHNQIAGHRDDAIHATWSIWLAFEFSSASVTAYFLQSLGYAQKDSRIPCAKSSSSRKPQAMLCSTSTRPLSKPRSVSMHMASVFILRMPSMICVAWQAPGSPW